MSIISWNCQGATSRDFNRVFKDMLRRHKPILVGLYEPKVSGTQADDIFCRVGLGKWLRVEAVGFIGGIWVFWTMEVEVEIVTSHLQFILLKVK